MKIITKRADVLSRLSNAAAQNIPLFCPNGETVDEMEGIFTAAEAFRRERNLPVVTVGLGITGMYPEHPQLKRLALNSELAADGVRFLQDVQSIESRAFVWLDWIAVYARHPDLFPGVEVIPFLDHGWAPAAADLALMQNPDFQERMGIIMFDASLLPFEENIARTSDFVRHAESRVVVEACPDKILSSAELRRKGAPDNLLTDPESAKKFVCATGVDLIVPSLGTEHRGMPGESIYYRRPLAQELRRRVGAILALHGTSSLGDKIGCVGQDGIVKVNFYTGMAEAASEAVRLSWGTPETAPLPVETAAGSFIHNIRRQKVQEECLRRLRLLHGTAPCRVE